MTEATASTDYRAAGIKKFKLLMPLYNGQEVSFWKLGNTFDTMIDFLATIDRTSADDVAQAAITQFDVSLKKLGGFDAAWFDDFGWWSVATLRAMNAPFFTKTAQGKFVKLFSDCWSRFSGNAPDVWQRHKPGTFEDCRPAVDGGVWNAYWQGTPATYHGPKNGDPTAGLIGVQNTVTNALFLMAAFRVNIPEWWKKELNFLDTWLNEKKESLWCPLDANAALVRERVGHFANGNRTPEFQDDWFWTGDQGLMLGNFSGITQDNGGVFRKRIQHLLAGVQQDLVDSTHVLLDYSTSGNVPGDDTADYETGSGVFWRNALYVWNTRKDLRDFFLSSDFQRMLRASAAAAAQSNDNGFEMLTNQTAVLVAATVMVG